MRIISDFHDYYDCVKATDFEQTPVYMRTTEIVHVDANTHQEYGYPSQGSYAHIWFCGKWFRCIAMGDRLWRTRPCEFDWCYSIDHLDRHVMANFSSREIDNYFAPPPRRRHWTHRRLPQPGRWKRYEIQRQFDGDEWQGRQSPEKYNQPIIAYAYGRIATNPRLADFGFQRVMDPHTCYQEIRMYIDGVLGNQSRPVPDVDDKTLAEAKGFDKWSFRKEPTKRRN